MLYFGTFVQIIHIDIDCNYLQSFSNQIILTQINLTHYHEYIDLSTQSQKTRISIW